MELRPHQITALNNLWTALQCEASVLCEAPCSFGKTIVIVKLISRLLDEHPTFRILVLVDREILVTQLWDKLLLLAPDLTLEIGIVCASVVATKDPHKRLTIASRQSLVKLLNKFEPVQLIVVDECHLVSVPREGEPAPADQFGVIIETLRGYNPNTRLLGVTATPYRLNDGYIYGDKNAPGRLPYWGMVHHRTTVAELQAADYLAPLVGKIVAPADMSEQLSCVGTTAGEYNLGRLSDLMEKSVHIASAVQVWQEYAAGRRKTIVFCVTISHADKLAEAFNAAGIPALAIHSELGDLESVANMQALKDGKARVFCSVAKLTTGMDVPDIDCILVARPTKSTALHKQMLGRGQRIAAGKIDCMVLDIVGNGHEHGTDLDRLKVRWNRGNGKDGQPVSKECPQCCADLHPAIRICPECGYEYPQTNLSGSLTPDMVDMGYGYQAPENMKVVAKYASIHESKKSGKKLLKVRLEMEDSYGSMVSAYLWMCFAGDGYSGFAVEKGKALWSQMTCGMTTYPASVTEAMSIVNLIITPDKALVDTSGQWPEIKSLQYEDIPF